MVRATTPQTISVKWYICPVCKTTQRRTTNHHGEIYVPCTNCTNQILYCNTPEGIEAREAEYNHTARLVKYYFNIENEWEEEDWYGVLQRITQIYGDNAPCSTVYFHNAHKKSEFSFIKTGPVKMRVGPWADQFVSEIGRVYRWRIARYPNKKIKEGYYLEEMPEWQEQETS